MNHFSLKTKIVDGESRTWLIPDGLWDLGVKRKFVVWVEISLEQLFSYERYGIPIL